MDGMQGAVMVTSREWDQVGLSTVPCANTVRGQRGRGGFSGYLLCLTSRACIEHALCAVLMPHGPAGTHSAS